MIKNFSALLTIGVLFLAGLACNGGFTTANITELKFGKNNKADPATTNFDTGEDIYALAIVGNAPDSKYKMKWRITYDNVAGKSKGEEVGTNTVDFEGSKQLWQSFSTPLPGEYKVEATLTDAEGKQIDAKTGTLTVKGSAPANQPSSNKKDSDDDN